MDDPRILELIDTAVREGADTLDLSEKGLTTLPREIAHLPNLERLLLKSNHLRELPSELWTLRNLEELDVEGNELTELPPQIGKLKKLRTLDISKNKLETLPQELFELSGLTVLAVDRNQLCEIPPDISKLQGLKYLYISNDELTALPSEIGQLQKLISLHALSNKLTVLPPEFKNLPHLSHLVFTARGMNTFPEVVCELTNLEVLFAFGVAMLPDDLSRLKKLNRLCLTGSRFKSFPPVLFELDQLRQLELGWCRLSELPADIKKLAKLEHLNLNGNEITSLPVELGYMTSLNELLVEKNPITTPPPEIVSQGTEAIKAFLRDQSQQSTRQWVSKLLLVGEGGVGKTSLLKVLLGEEFIQGEFTTHGIAIRDVPLDHPTLPGVRMNLKAWDFGGQEIYHATHQFFLTNRSLFLLAWNARLGFEQGKLYYWLDTIKSRAPESPVIIVATHVDERDANLPIDELRRKYPQISGYCQVSNKEGTGFDVLRVEIAAAASSLPLMGESWPTNWLTAANSIRALRETHILPSEMRAIMRQHDVADDKADVLSQWLHELGDILYFRNDPELNDIVLLNPQWATQSISTVLESEEVKRRQGLFTRDHMDEIWSDIDPTMRSHFLRLMEKFDLSYRTLEDKDISLVVERLGLNHPPYEEAWNPLREREVCNEMSMKFVLVDATMPPGIPTWFIARAHRFTTHTHWLYGALFADGPERKHLGLVQSFPHERYLKLTVRGPLPHNFFTLLRDGLEYIFARFPGLKIARRIPCPGHDGQPCTHEFDLANLQKAIERNPPRMEIQCPVSFEDVSVPGLLFGLNWSTTSQVMARLDSLVKTEARQHEEVLDHIDNVRDEVKELSELAQRQFTNLFRLEQAKIDSQCPNVFILRPRGTNKWWKAVKGQTMELQLFCQAPGRWHPTLDGGLYVIDQPAPWLRAIAPYVKGMVTVLKYAAPLVGPGLGVEAPEYAKQLEHEIKLMEELVDKLPEIDDEVTAEEALEQGNQPERAGGATLRSLRILLEKKDPTKRWGGLELVATPEGHYFWLCKHHAAAYRV